MRTECVMSPKTTATTTHDNSSFQNKTAVSGLNVRGNEVHEGYLDWSNNYKTLG